MSRRSGLCFQHRLRKTSYKCAAIGSLLLVAGLLQGCSMTSASVAPTPTATLPPPTATTPASLPTLPRLPGYHTVIDITSTASTGGAGNQFEQTVGSFTATKPYAVMVACLGTGTITVNFTQGALPLTCAPSGAYQTLEFDSPLHQQNAVSVTVAGDFTYHVLIQIEN